MKDIAVFAGGKAFTEDLGVSVLDARLADLGRVKKAIINRDSTALLEGAGTAEAITARAKMIRAGIYESTDPSVVARLQERVARLVGGIAVIRAGGVTDDDVLDQTYRIRSAMNSTYAAIDGGWVSGGGLALLRAKHAVVQLPSNGEAEDAGIGAVAHALEQPIYHLIENSGRSPTQVLHEMQEAATPTVGFKAQSGKLEDLDATGVIDPALVLCQALRIALSHVRELLLTGAWELTPPNTAGLPPARP